MVLFGLSILLIYSLMLGNLGEKMYEYGMLRALGMRNKTLIGLLFGQAMAFALPGMSLGFLLAWIVGILGKYYLATYVHLAISYSMALSAIEIGLVLGIGMPIVANIVPVKRALSKTIRDALDVYHVSYMTVC